MKEGIAAALMSSSHGNGVTMLATPLSPCDLWIPAGQMQAHFRQVAGCLLARAADDVLTIISRNKDELRDLEFSTKKRLRASTGWIVLPADYARFIADREAEHDRRQRKLYRPDGWASWMRTCASLHRRPGHMVPIVPEYDDKPFAAALIFGDPTGLRRGFDNRYFTSTTEFNLLNALLYGPVGQP